MPKKFRVVSLASPVKGKSAQEVVAGLGRLGMKAEQANALLRQPLVIKKDLDKPRALQYIDKFTEAGLMVKAEAYEVEEAAEIRTARQQQEDLFAYLHQAFAQPLAPTRISREYHKSFAVALVAALVAPVLYFGLILFIVWLLVWYFTVGHDWLMGDWDLHGKVLLMQWAAGYVTPAVAGGIVLLFLLYPFWPQGKPPKPNILDRKKQRRFYQLVDDMAKSIGVPAPQYIEIMAEVNAAAGPTRGMVSLVKGELVLVLGLSLVAGTSVQQLLGIIAHEFGHFSQRNSMLAYSWINRVSRWLNMCAYGDDIWLQRLDKWKEQYDFELVQMSLTATEWMIIAVRSLFRQLYDLNLRLTRPMSQQMEFDADLYEARVVGSRQFRASTMALRKLGFGWQMAHDVNADALHADNRLWRNLPAAVVALTERLPAESLRQIEAGLAQETTQYWHSHPADQARVDHAKRANEPGILQCDRPAAELFEDFDKLCENCTLGWYFSWGISGAREFVADNAQIMAKVRVEKESPQRSAREPSTVQESAPLADAVGAAPHTPDGMIEWTGSRKDLS